VLLIVHQAITNALDLFACSIPVLPPSAQAVCWMNELDKPSLSHLQTVIVADLTITTSQDDGTNR